MASVVAYVKELSKLPAHQRRVLVPLVTWQITLENPNFELDDGLRTMVDDFVKSLGCSPDQVGERLQELLRDAGIGMDVLRDLQLRASLPPLAPTQFAQRVAPTRGQVRGELGLRLMSTRATNES